MSIDLNLPCAFQLQKLRMVESQRGYHIHWCALLHSKDLWTRLHGAEVS